jgi:hypothetical protein
LVSHFEGRTQMMFENKAQPRTFRLKRQDATLDWRKLHEEEHHYLYS